MIAFLITARMGSSRLPQKHLIMAAGKPLLYWLIKRFEHEFEKEIADGEVTLAVATSEMPGNERFSEATAGTSCQVIHGSDSNIPLRHLQCAKRLGASHVISIDGDDILCSPRAARAVYTQMLKDNDHDLFVITGLPLGMNLSGYPVTYLERSLASQERKKLETGWGRIFKDPRTWTLPMGNYDIMGDLRFTLDYQEDADFFCAVIDHLKEETIAISDADLISLVEQEHLYRINASLKETYWSNYNTEKEKEANGKE